MRQDAVKKFIEENMKTIFAYALSRVSDKEDAEDLAGDIVIAILQSTPRLKEEKAFYGYVWAIAANTYKKFLHNKNRFHDAEMNENYASEEDLLDGVVQEEEFFSLRRELALLSKEYRECTVAYYFEGLSCAEIASRFSISSEMVKYYLFKTRKILKEGIGMERIFGEKSYHPAEFHFVTIFSGQYNAEYRNLFDRRLPGNILLSAYYTPMTIRELSIELGVSAAYMEDEIALLEKYGLITSLNGGRYQTNLIVFTEAYTEECIRKLKNGCEERVLGMLSYLRDKLDAIRGIGFKGASLSDERILWGLLWMLIREGNALFEKEHAESTARDALYRGATGINYGVDYNEYAGEYSADAYAGYVKLNDVYAAAFADFEILPQKNRFSNRTETVTGMIEPTVQGDILPEFMIFTQTEICALSELLAEELIEMKSLYEWLATEMTAIMKMHAPRHMGEMAEHIVASTILFRSVGFIGASAVKSGAIALPDDEKPIAFYVYKTE
jgi:RNA polymerase sigma factor (sigma-70 family)